VILWLSAKQGKSLYVGEAFGYLVSCQMNGASVKKHGVWAKVAWDGIKGADLARRRLIASTRVNIGIKLRIGD